MTLTGPLEIDLVTYNRTLKNNLEPLCHALFGESLGKKVKLNTFHSFVSKRLKECKYEVPKLEYNEEIFLRPGLLAIKPEHLAKNWTKDIVNFIYREIVNVIAPQKIDSIQKYVRAPRKGTGKTLGIKQKEELWKIFELSWAEAKKRLSVPPGLLSMYALELNLPALKDRGLVVDEMQDLSAADLAFLAEQAPGANQLTLLEDMKQRIYGFGYNLKSLGINVKGKRSTNLFVNYRTTEEIGETAVKSLESIGIDPIDIPVSLRHGKTPEIKTCHTPAEEHNWVVAKIHDCKKRNIKRIAVLSRTKKHLEDIEAVLEAEGIDFASMDRDFKRQSDGSVLLCTMHSAKGLEFEAVFIVGLKSLGSGLSVPKDIKSDEVAAVDFERREKNLLYVAMSRARDELYISGKI